PGGPARGSQPRRQACRKVARASSSPAGVALVAATCLVLTGAARAGGPAGPMRVQGIRVSESNGDTAVVIAASARPTFTTWKLEKPARVVVDISGARLGDLDVPFDANTYAVGAI